LLGERDIESSTELTSLNFGVTINVNMIRFMQNFCIINGAV
jgi:hypothetical protein